MGWSNKHNICLQLANSKKYYILWKGSDILQKELGLIKGNLEVFWWVLNNYTMFFKKRDEWYRQTDSSEFHERSCHLVADFTVGIITYLLWFISLLLVCIFQRRLIMASILSVKELPIFYKAKLNQHQYWWHQDHCGLDTNHNAGTEPTVPMKPVINAPTRLIMIVTFCMIMICLWKHCKGI